MANTLEALIASHDADAPAVGAPGRDWMTYGNLRAQTQAVRSSLRQCGVTAKDRVAIVLPNGPEMAVAFVTIAQSATTAPLNPAYREDEFAFYLDDLGSKAIVVLDGYEGPALSAATRLGLDIIRLRPEFASAAGTFSLNCSRGAAPDDNPGTATVALILHTSGTTSRPKIVPLLQSNIAASARHIGESLALTTSDRCLNIMPLFHIHGLIASITASLAAGASVWCAPGFDALKFFGWMSEARPTWFTAVPTMHQAILSRADRNSDIVKANRLRFIRSSSASLPPQVFSALSAAFKAPVLESYGMTEAAHQMASNPLPPREQKPGAVGIGAGPLVRIADENENRLVEGTGEVVISGPNVTPGYENNPEANQQSFFEFEGRRWFRTGDQGAFDDDGYLKLTGRLKEIINRGGEKISPLEIDELLMDHPAVQQCVAFACPHPKLGEEVAAAIVLRDGMSATETEFREFAAKHVADYKVPRKIVILDEIPKGATGKMQRIGMADKLGLTK